MAKPVFSSKTAFEGLLVEDAEESSEDEQIEPIEFVPHT
jgi:hypothetical protein